MQSPRRGRRGNLELIHEFLECVHSLGGGDPVPKTNVMHCSNLNTTSFSRYLSLLENNGIVVSEGGGIRLTAQGLFVKQLAYRILRAINLYAVNPLIVRIGLLLHQRLNVVYRDSAAIVPPCDYVVAITPERVLCISVERGFLALRCCSLCSCNDARSVRLDELIAADDGRVVDEFIGAAEECLRRPSSPAPR